MSLTSKEFIKLFPQITEHINNKEVSDFIGMLNHVSASKNTKIISDNNKNDTLYFVISGELECYIENDDTRITIGKIFPGEYVGEISMLDNENATSSVITKTPCVFYTLDKASFDILEKKNPVISGKILRSVSSIITNRLISSDKLLFDGIMNHNKPYSDQDESEVGSSREWFVKIYHQLHH